MAQISPDRIARFQELLGRWYRKGRRRFSWRSRRRSAYATLVAEMMLRKTDAAKVARVYDRFLAAYPTIDALAAADEDDVRQQIAILGIADRARLLVLSARKLNAEHGGRVPSEQKELLALPGVGRYTANAVLCFAYGRDAAILDTNVIRVVDRVFSVRSAKPRPHEDPLLWDFAASLVPAGKSITHNRAILDLAAKVCTARHPQCESCPLLPLCDYGRARLTGQGAG